MIRTAKIIEYTIEVIEDRGWTQGKAEDELGRVCLNTAILIAIKNNDEAITASRNRTVNRLLPLLPPSNPSIISFNDDPRTTKTKVLNLLRKAAKPQRRKSR